jgi:hypothetical protein
MTLGKTAALEKLRRQRDAIAGIPPDASSPEFKKWQRDTEIAIANIFSKGGRHDGEFQRLDFPNPLIRASMPPSWWTESCRDAFAHAKVMLQRLGLHPVVLHEKPNSGRTIIEKFAGYSAVGFAVVLLSPDDVGRESKKQSDELCPRPRQNVILELGFFLGKLGRDHVVALSRLVDDLTCPRITPV